MIDADDVLSTAPPHVDDDLVRSLLRDRWGVEAAQLRRLGSERDVNVLVDDAYVLKIANAAEPLPVLEMELAAMQHMQIADPGLVIPRAIPTVDGRMIVEATGQDGRIERVRLISALDGEPLEGVALSADRAEAVGGVAGRAAVALSGFFHAAGGRTLDWDPRRVIDVMRRRPVAGSESLVRRLRSLSSATRPLPASVLHADVTLTNVLADADTITGLIDFGDMHHTAYVADLAITMTSVLRNSAIERPATTEDLLSAVLTGYQRQRRLSPPEVEVLGELILARLLLTLAISGSRTGIDGGDDQVITRYDRTTRDVLDELSADSPAHLAERLHRIAGTGRSPRRVVVDGHREERLADRRAAAMGGSISPLFYRRPLEIVSGAGAWLVARDGTRYLDAYNNVAVVGHAHPAVVSAVSEQLGALNSHSRYLHPGVVELAERLVATFPDELDTALFTTSGTEANELAWRIATEHTGGDAAIIVRHAYHGTTRWMADLSSNEWPAGHRPTQVGTIEAPHGLTEADGHAEAVARVSAAVRELADRGHRPAMVIIDPCFTSEGVLDAPASFLSGLVDAAHAAGALFVADEVQSGYGRTGPQVWRHALAEITPDIVTLGKPMGAGYPMGGTITSRATLAALGSRYEYFSTFAASAVAAAAGNAVLDVLEDGALMHRAVRTGDDLRTGLRDLASRHAALGEVRGTGLIAGIDLFPQEPTARRRELAVDLLERLVTEGRVLAGLTGAEGNVLKVRPPLVWDGSLVECFLERMSAIVASS